MYKIYVGDHLFYDSSNLDAYPVVEPTLDLALKDAGSFDFTVMKGHPYYDEAKNVLSIVRAYRDDDEIFYGRILTYEKDLYGNLQIYCEGTTTFLLDSEMVKGKWTETPAAFFRRCINNHNSQVEAAKQFTARNVTIDEANTSTTFELTDFNNTKEVLEDELIGQFGGYLVITPKAGGGHYIDYIQKYSHANSQPIQIGQNIIDKDDKYSGESVFTVFRPIGNDNLTISSLSQSDIQIPNCTKDGEFLKLNDLIAKYGRIVHTETFGDKTTAISLLRAAEKFVTGRRSHLPGVSNIKYVDFCHLNPEIQAISIGDTYTNIVGFEGETLTISEQSIHFDDPGKDDLAFKNAEEMAADDYPNRIGSRSSLSSGGRGGGGGLSGYSAMQFKYITEGDELLQLHTKRIDITAEETLNLASQVMNISANTLWVYGQGDDASFEMYIDGSKLDPTAVAGQKVRVDGLTFYALQTPDGKPLGKLEVNDLVEVFGSNVELGKENLKLLNGKMNVDKNGHIHVVDGSQLYMDKGSASLAVYDSSNLTAGVIVNKINGGTVKIQAKNIELDGKVIAKYIENEYITCARIEAPVGQINDLEVDSLTFSSGIIDDSNIITSIGPATSSNGRITIPYTYANGEAANVNFNIADMQYYKDHVGISSSSLLNHSDDITDYNDWQLNNSFSITERFNQIRVVAKNGAYYHIGISIGQLAGTSISLTDISRSVTTITGNIKLYGQQIRTFSIATNATSRTCLFNGMYDDETREYVPLSKLPANTLYYGRY